MEKSRQEYLNSIRKRKSLVTPKPSNWKEKFFECKDLNQERGIDPSVINKEGFWTKREPNDYKDKETSPKL